MEKRFYLLRVSNYSEDTTSYWYNESFTDKSAAYKYLKDECIKFMTEYAQYDECLQLVSFGYSDNDIDEEDTEVTELIKTIDTYYDMVQAGKFIPEKISDNFINNCTEYDLYQTESGEYFGIDIYGEDSYNARDFYCRKKYKMTFDELLDSGIKDEDELSEEIQMAYEYNRDGIINEYLESEGHDLLP